MYMGVCVESAPANGLFLNPMHPYTKELFNAIPIPSLDPEKKLKNIIGGEVTSPINPPNGCRFAPRCKYASKKCMGCNLPLSEIAPEHYVACSLFEGR